MKIHHHIIVMFTTIAAFLSVSVPKSTGITPNGIMTIGTVWGISQAIQYADDIVKMYTVPHAITMWKDSTTALVDGRTVELTAAPFIQNNVFYYPLGDIVKLRGGKYSLDGSVATVQFNGTEWQYHVGRRIITINGVDYPVIPGDPRFDKSGTKANPTTIVPILRDGIVYLPADYREYANSAPENILSLITQYAWDNMVILSGGRQEEGVAGFYLQEHYDSLPQALRNTMICNGIVGQILQYDIVEYERDGLLVHVMRLHTGEDDWENMDGRISDICITNENYTTARGLRCGDSAERAWALYGYDYVNSFSFDTQDGIITRFGFYTRYNTFHFHSVYD